MFYLIGTDEAGYGPNLGPLAVSATLWRVENDALSPDALYDALAPVAVQSGAGRKEQKEGKDGKEEREKQEETRIPIADSKKLHRRETLAPLETAVFAALTALGKATGPLDSSAACDILCGMERSSERRRIPWHTPESELILPKDLSWERVERLGDALADIMTRSGVALCEICSDLVFPERFNAETDDAGSKGVVLSDTTMKLIVRCWNEVQKMESERLISATGISSDFFSSSSLGVSGGSSAFDASEGSGSSGKRPLSEVRVFCDKHGGRNFYLPTLMEFFPTLPFCVVHESREFSEYVHYGEYATLRIRFQAKGEAFLPVALASMVSKYLREISMERFNLWWRLLLPEIRPTAGYPLDAKRFREEIAPKMEELNLNWDQFWRKR